MASSVKSSGRLSRIGVASPQAPTSGDARSPEKVWRGGPRSLEGQSLQVRSGLGMAEAGHHPLLQEKL